MLENLATTLITNHPLAACQLSSTNCRVRLYVLTARRQDRHQTIRNNCGALHHAPAGRYSQFHDAFPGLTSLASSCETHRSMISSLLMSRMYQLNCGSTEAHVVSMLNERVRSQDLRNLCAISDERHEIRVHDFVFLWRLAWRYPCSRHALRPRRDNLSAMVSARLWSIAQNHQNASRLL